VAIDLMTAPKRADAPGVAICRVEQLYPLPADEIAAVIRGYPHLREVVWVQEEPRNMGAWEFIRSELGETAGGFTLQYVGRLRMSSPAEGSASRHARQQARIIEQALQVGAEAHGGRSVAVSQNV
jgi:2-oxoglutarate dehydrogenase E1 component